MDDYLIQSSDNAKDNLLKIVLCLTDKMVISNRWYFINRFANGSLVNDNNLNYTDNISDILRQYIGHLVLAIIANTVFEYRKSAIEGIKMKVLRCLNVWYIICDNINLYLRNWYKVDIEEKLRSDKCE